MGVALVAVTVLDVKIVLDGITLVLEVMTMSLLVIVAGKDGSIELVVLHTKDGITVVLEVITISLLVIVVSKNGSIAIVGGKDSAIELIIVVNLIDSIILVL